MLNVKIITVGKLKEHFYIDACAEYQKRLSAFCKLELIELSEEVDRPDGLEREEKRVLEAIPSGVFTAALCIEGDEMSSEKLSKRLARLQVDGNSRLCFIIGSSNGLSDAVKRRADMRLSMSPMTFPHHLARVMLLEQLYRAFSISAGGKYHK